MINAQSEPQGFQPLHSAHAIEQVVLTVQFSPEVDEGLLKEIDQATKQFKDDLPKRSEIRNLTIALGPALAGPAAPISPVAGVVMQKFREDGSAEAELRADRTSIVFNTLNYSRWKNVWQKAEQYLSVLLPIYAKSGAISAIGLNYVDKFIWHGDLNKMTPGQLLRPGSDYLSPIIFRCADLWHSHTGAFSAHDEKTKRLINVNVDALDEQKDEGQRRTIVIRTLHSDMFNQPSFQPIRVSVGEIKSVVDKHMQALHEQNKQTLKAILTDDMARRIALEE